MAPGRQGLHRQGRRRDALPLQRLRIALALSGPWWTPNPLQSLAGRGFFLCTCKIGRWQKAEPAIRSSHATGCCGGSGQAHRDALHSKTTLRKISGRRKQADEISTMRVAHVSRLRSRSRRSRAQVLRQYRWRQSACRRRSSQMSAGSTPPVDLACGTLHRNNRASHWKHRSPRLGSQQGDVNAPVADGRLQNRAIALFEAMAIKLQVTE